MKKNRLNIFCSWFLLICFTAGQCIVFAHQHKLARAANKTHTVSHSTSHQSVSEKCSLCDAMHFNTMLANEHPSVVHLLAAAHYDYKAVTRTFISFSLILSPGRAPPFSS